MKQLLTVLFCLTSFFSNAQKKDVPASPYPLTEKQPNGTNLVIYGKGDESRHYSVTEDGYTIVKNFSGIYEYAEPGTDGRLQPSGIAANNLFDRGSDEKRYLQTIQKEIKPDRIESTERLKSTQILNSFPNQGQRKVLLLLIKYPDLNSNYTVGNFNDLMNKQNYNSTGSFRDYFLTNSNSSLDMSTDVFGWYTASHNYTYYGDVNGDDRARELVREAIDAAQAAGVDFSVYDNNNDGVVDNLLVVHSGPGAEEGSKTQYIWSHSWELGSYSRTYDGVLISPYCIQPETRSYGMVGIGLFCHEFGHALGLPDLYDTDGSSEGIGYWCVMASGCWLNQERTPAMMSSYCREQLSWNSPTVINWPISSPDIGNYTLQPSATSEECFKILTQNSNEYFLLENKYKTGFNAALPGSGLAIFHINTNKSNNTDESHKLVDVEEADGRTDLDTKVNKGDAGDVFPGSSANSRFNDTTSPNAKTYDSKLTGIDIQGITLSGSTINFTLGAASAPQPNLTYNASQNSLTVNGTVVNVSVQVTNNGNASAGTFKVGYYLSADNTISTSDYLIGTSQINSLANGSSTTVGINTDVSTVPSIPNGTYYIGYIIDYLGNITESNENDNNFTFTSPQVQIVNLPNLTFIANNNALQVNGNIVDISLSVINNGNVSSGLFKVGYYLSSNNSITTSDYLIGTSQINSLAIGASTPVNLNVDINTLPSVPDGIYYVGYIIDYLGNINESNENDNNYIFTSPLLQHNVASNLTYLNNGNSLQVSGTSVNISMTVTNDGNLTSGSFTIGYYLSTNNTITTSDYLIGTDLVASLGAGANIVEGLNVDLNTIQGLPDGTYYVGYIIDYLGSVSESNENDNTYIFLTPQVRYSTSRNLTYIINNNILQIKNDSISIALTVKNDGTALTGSCLVGYYLSTDNNINTSDYFLGNDAVGPLNSNETSNENISVKVPDVIPNLPNGNYYVGYLIDYQNEVGETNESDNSFVFTNQLFNYCKVQYNNINKTICQGDSFLMGNTYYKTSGIYTKFLKDIHFCDSVVTLNLIVNPSYNSNITQSLCFGDSIKVGNSVFKTTGTYTVKLQTQAGCDSVITLNLTVHPVSDTILYKTICQGELYLLGNKSYNTSGVYKDTLTSRFGCDSIITLNLTVASKKEVLITKSICQGDSFMIGNSNYKLTGIYTKTLISYTGCDSVVTLNLTVNPVNRIQLSDTICQGDSYLMAGERYFNSGVYTKTIQNRYGCDSILTLNLTVIPVRDTIIQRQICKGDSVILGNSVFKTAGIYEKTLLNEGGCSYKTTLYLSTNKADTINLNRVICEGDSIVVGKISYKTTGRYINLLTNQTGCDSLVYLNLTVNPVHRTLLSKTICQGQSVSVGTKIYTTTGLFVNYLKNQFGCDSIVTLDLRVNPINETSLNYSICKGDSIVIGTSAFKTTGNYTSVLMNRFGCDSVIHLNLTVRPTYNLVNTKDICEGDSVVVGRSVYKVSGIYKDSLRTILGCDSIITTQVNIKPSNKIVLNRTICQGESIDLGASTYTKTGTYYQTYTNQYGCDSVFILNLQVNPTYIITLSDTICQGESFMMDGKAYNSTGTYVKSMVTQFGCDSIITLNLTVNPVSGSRLDIELCSGKSFNLGGKTYTEPGTYEARFVNRFGCDSIVTLNLTVIPPIRTYLYKTICQGGSVTIGNKVYNETGIYSTILKSYKGCDSTVILDLKVEQTNISEFFESICFGKTYRFGNIEINSSGFYSHTYTNQFGCDSVVILHLVVLPVSDTLLDKVIEEGDSIVIGHTVYNTTGTYINKLLNYAGCDSTVTLKLVVKKKVPDAIFDLKNRDGIPSFTVYPNPASGNVSVKIQNLAGDYIIRLVSTDGRTMAIKKGKANGGVLTEQLSVKNLSNGIYSITIESGGKRESKKLVVKN